VADPYPAELRATFERLIDAVGLDERQQDFFKSRWLDQVVWMEGKAAKAQRWYYRLRLITVVGAVTVPALVSLSALGGRPGDAASVATWIVSLIVAVSAAIEGLPSRSRSNRRRGSAHDVARQSRQEPPGRRDASGRYRRSALILA
jgi:hypothetical protein